MANSTRGLLVFVGAGSNAKGVYLYNVASTGTVTIQAVFSAEGVTVTPASGKIMAENASGGYTTALVLEF